VACFQPKHINPSYLPCKLHVRFIDFRAVLGLLLAGVKYDLEFRERCELVVAAIGRFT
jgi:hypothetical protein